MSFGAMVFVDDDRDELELVAGFHRRANVRQPLVSLEQPELLFEYFRLVDCGQQPTPWVVLVDVNLASVDGFDVVRQLRQAHPRFEHVALLSNARTSSDVERAAALGVRVLVKPSGLRASVRFLQDLSAQRLP